MVGESTETYWTMCNHRNSRIIQEKMLRANGAYRSSLGNPHLRGKTAVLAKKKS